MIIVYLSQTMIKSFHFKYLKQFDNLIFVSKYNFAIANQSNRIALFLQRKIISDNRKLDVSSIGLINVYNI